MRRDDMNIIDKQFNELTLEIKNLSREEIFDNTKQSFFNINSVTQKSMIDFFQRFNYWGKLDIENEEFEHFELIVESLKDHLEDHIWLYNHLGDYRSKKLLFAILNNWYRCDFANLSSAHEKNFWHYFDLDLVSCEDEVMVDLGAYNGDTISDFIKIYGDMAYKKIYAYEMSSDNFIHLEKNTKNFKNIVLRQVAVMDKEGTFFIGENSPDASAYTVNDNNGIQVKGTSLDIDIKEEISLIKMDIEGSEQKALLGSYKHIVNDKPKLLISVYHNHEDIWKIPRIIEDMTPDTYNFYLRSYGGNVFPTEIVLIALPKH